MSTKIFVLICLQALLIQSAFTQENSNETVEDFQNEKNITSSAIASSEANTTTVSDNPTSSETDIESVSPTTISETSSETTTSEPVAPITISDSSASSEATESSAEDAEDTSASRTRRSAAHDPTACPYYSEHNKAFKKDASPASCPYLANKGVKH